MLTTRRLTLTAPRDEDEEVIWKIHSDPRTYPHRPELVMTSRAEAHALLHRWQADWSDHGIGYFLVSEQHAGPIGFCGTRPTEHQGQPVLNLYYRFAPEAQGQGYAEEATRAALDWVTAQKPSAPVVALISPANQPSARLALKLGMEPKLHPHDEVDHIVYRYPERLTLPCAE